MIVSNPFLEFREFRNSGRSRYSHDGNRPRLGPGQGLRGLGGGYYSPVEVNFRETGVGQETRGGIRLNDFYQARQILKKEILWHWEGNSPNQGAWVEIHTKRNAPDDPDPQFIYFSDRPPGISFYDSPGFYTYTIGELSENVHRVGVIQNFKMWIQVNPRFSNGNFPASSHQLWHHLLFLQRNGPYDWQVRRDLSLLGRGELLMRTPMWD